jgi:hypothetical protein
MANALSMKRPDPTIVHPVSSEEVSYCVKPKVGTDFASGHATKSFSEDLFKNPRYFVRPRVVALRAFNDAAPDDQKDSFLARFDMILSHCCFWLVRFLPATLPKCFT